MTALRSIVCFAVLLTGCSGEEPTKLPRRVPPPMPHEVEATTISAPEEEPAEPGERVEAKADGEGEDQAVISIGFTDLEFKPTGSKTFDSMSLSKKARDLDGKRVRIQGMMYWTFKEKGISKFALTTKEHVLDCGFRSSQLPPGDVAVVSLKNPTHFTLDEITVEGILRISPMWGYRGELLGVFHLDDAQLVAGKSSEK